jgi:hypothetical protein
MNNNSSKSSSDSNGAVTLFFQGLILVGGLIGLYYLYQYLFSASTMQSSVLVGSNTVANPTAPITIQSSNLPPLYEGGEFSVSMWLYVQNWGVRAGYNKHILSVGGKAIDTIRIYLGANKPALRVRLHTAGMYGPGGQQKSTVSGFQSGPSLQAMMGTSSAPPPPLLGSSSAPLGSTPDQPTEALDGKSRDALFTTLYPDSSLLDGTALCDLPAIDLQKWVCVAVAVNGRTVDVYIDGKLARSCVLPALYKVDAGGYAADLLDYGGFGGYVNSIQMYNYALNPNTVYNLYMGGPNPITSLGSYLSSFFTPSPNTGT